MKRVWLVAGSILLLFGIVAFAQLGVSGHFFDVFFDLPPESHLFPEGFEGYESEAFMVLSFHLIDSAESASIGDANATLRPDQEIVEPVILSGPVIIRREPLNIGSSGLDGVIETEMVSMQLTGNSPTLGPVSVQLDPDRPSQGQISGSVDPLEHPELFFPADSFFDVFFEVEVEGQLFRNPVPVRLQGTASDPLLPDDEHQSQQPVPLLPQEEIPVQGVIEEFRFVPLPSEEKKLSKVIIKKQNTNNNKITNIMNAIDSNMLWAYVDSRKFTVPAGHTRVLGANVSGVHESMDNPFDKTAELELCVEADDFFGRYHLLLDVSGDGEYHQFAQTSVGTQHKCFEAVTNEFRLLVKNFGGSTATIEASAMWKSAPHRS